MDINFGSLLLLLKASSRNQVKTILRLAHKSPPVCKILRDIRDQMELNQLQFNTMLHTLKRLTMSFLREWPLDFPDNFHQKLKELLLTLLEELKTELRKESKQPSLAKLLDFDWRFDIQAASSGLERTPRIPKVSLELNLETGKEILQLDRQKVSALLENLTKVKEQLDDLADL